MVKRLPSVGLWAGLLLAWNPSATGAAPGRDRYGDPLPPGTIARLGTTRLRHFGRTFDVAFSPNGSMLASVGEDRRVRLWDAKTGRQLHEFPGFKVVAFSPDGKLLAAESSDGLRLWDVASGRPLEEPAPPNGRFLGFSPDGELLAFTKVVNLTPTWMAREEAVSLWERATGKVIRTWKINASTYSATFSPDGRALAIGTNEWVPRPGAKKTDQKSPGHSTGVLSLWETATGKERWRSPRRFDAILSVTFAPDGKTLVSAGEFLDAGGNKRHGSINFWDADGGKLLRELPAPDARVDCVRFSPDGRYLASICGPGPTILWDVKAAGGPRRVWEVPDNGWGVAFAPDSRRLAWCARQAIRTLDLPPPKEQDNLGGHTGSWPIASASIPFVAFAPDGKTVVSAGDRVRIWDANTGAELRAASELLRDCSAAALRPDGKTLITGSRGLTALWDLASLKVLRTFATPDDYVLAMALSPDGKTLAATLEHTLGGTRSREMMVRLWDVDSGKEKPPIRGTHAPQLTFAPEGDRLACVTMYQNGTMRFWDLKTGRVSLDVKSKTRWGPGRALLCLSPDGKLLASAEEDDSIRLWDARSGEPVRALRGRKERMRTLTFSPDGKLLLSGGEDSLRLWDVASGKMLHELFGHQAAVVAAAFSRDGRRIASASEDTTILIWDVAGLARLVPKPPPPLTEEELRCLWSDLGSGRSPLRERTLRRIRAAPEATVALLKRRLKPDLPRGNRLARLLDELDSDSFAVREKASRELARMDKSAGPVLRRVLAEDLSPEKRRRVQAVVDTLPRPQRPFRGIAVEECRLLQAVVLLDRIDTAEAVDLLRYLARCPELTALLADPSVWEGELREAKAALARRANHSAGP